MKEPEEQRKMLITEIPDEDEIETISIPSTNRLVEELEVILLKLSIIYRRWRRLIA